MDFKKIVPHLIAVACMLLVSMVFFAPNVFNGKVLRQGDNDQARGMQTEAKAYFEKEGKAPLWTNSTFGGMPTFQIYAPTSDNLAKPVSRAVFLWQDLSAVWAQVFVAMALMYFFLMVLGVDWRVGLFGAFAYGITTYNADILTAGHSTKMAALAYAPALLASAALIFRGRWWLGAGALALFTSMQIFVNHVQITYYSLILIGIYILAELANAVRHKTYARWGKGVLIAGLALLLGLFSNLSKLWPTYEYGAETIRGKSELSSKAESGDGLTKDYLFGWSYGIGESLTLLVPHYAGGGNNESYTNTEIYKVILRQMPQGTPKSQAEQQAGMLLYTGDQPFVGTAIYFGAIVCFLFFFGAFLVKGPEKWWLLAGGLFAVSLAWGKYFFLNDIWYNVMPMFKKFRAVSMALGMAQLCFAALGALGLQKLMDADVAVSEKKRALWIATGITVVLCLLALVTGGDSPNDSKNFAGNAEILDLVRKDRMGLLRGDVLRTLGLIATAAGLIWLYLQGQIKAAIAVLAIAFLSLADNWMICKRTLTSDNYTDKKSALAPPKPEDFDNLIRTDKDIHYRVLDLARGSITSNATSSYFHKSMSGYHAAKLQRYQEVVDRYFGEQLSKSIRILGMMNVKYLVTQNGQVMPNTDACGHAWFVKNWQFVPTADAELAALANLNPKDTAVVQQSYAGYLQGLNPQRDSAARIDLVAYHPDKMEYEYSSATEQLAVFPEIYYPPAKGWNCYLNGQAVEGFIKVNYLVRGMRLPAGQKMKLEMRFEPRSYYTGGKISMAVSALTILLFLFGLIWWFRNHSLDNPSRLSEVERQQAPRQPAKPAPKQEQKKRR